MKVNGCDCSIIIKTAYREIDVPYSEETLRDAYSMLQEEASIEGYGLCRAIRKKSGVTGCLVTPLTIGTAPILLYLAMGAAGVPVYVSETRNLYICTLSLLPMPDTVNFDLVQDRGNERLLYEGCRVQGFELRFDREQAVKLKLDITGERSAVAYPYQDIFQRENAERFFGDNVIYTINSQEYSNIYGLTLVCKKDSGSKTEIWIKRSLEKNNDIPEIIDELQITAKLQKDIYEYRHFGLFRITLKNLVLIADETDINSTGAVVGSRRYYVSGGVSTDVYTSTEGNIA